MKTELRRSGVPLLFCGVLLLPAASAVAQEPGADGGDRVTMSLEDIDLVDVLKTFAVQFRMSIVAGSDVTGKVTMNLFDVQAEEALRAVLSVNGYGYRKSGEFYIVERLELQPSGEVIEPIEVAVVWLNYLSAEEALRLIDSLKSADGTFTAGTAAERGIESDATDAGGNLPAGGEVLVLRDHRDVLIEVKSVIAEIDRRPRQVLVEATILEVELDDETTLGVDFNTLGGLNFSDLNATSNLNTLLLDPATSGQVADGFNSISTHGFASNLNTDGMHIGIVKDDVAVFIEALERVTDTTVLANTRVLAVDRQRAEIIIGAKLGYQTTTTTETATVQEVEFLDTGTQLRFRPYISGDGFIRLEVHPENSTGIVDQATGLPSETTTEVTTNVLVRDGNTICIGGLIGEQVETAIRQVPLLGSIPYLGVLFRQTIDRVSRREVIVLLTPHIVDGGESDLDALEQADAMANTRDLVLGKQLPISRSRLATPWIVKAERALHLGKADDAARFAEAALSYIPSDVRAAKIRLRALVQLGIDDEEVRALQELEGLR